MKNKIEDLRNHLFAALERLDDPECDLQNELKKAQAVAEIGKVLVESAKAEVAFLKVAAEREGREPLGSGFMSEGKRTLELPTQAG